MHQRSTKMLKRVEKAPRDWYRSSRDFPFWSERCESYVSMYIIEILTILYANRIQRKWWRKLEYSCVTSKNSFRLSLHLCLRLLGLSGFLVLGIERHCCVISIYSMSTIKRNTFFYSLRYEFVLARFFISKLIWIILKFRHKAFENTSIRTTAVGTAVLSNFKMFLHSPWQGFPRLHSNSNGFMCTPYYDYCKHRVN